MKLKLGLLVGMAMLAGCASTPKPEMSQYDYSNFSKGWVVVDKCGTQGDIDPVLAAYGKTRIEQEMYAYSFNLDVMNSNIREWQSTPGAVSKEDCNKAAVYFAGLRDEYDRNSRGSTFNKPTQASCYTTPYGSVTNCVSY